MAKKQKFDLYFESRGGEGPVALYFASGPYANGIEATEGRGIGFFSDSGGLLAVQFDCIIANKDRQTLRFENGTLVEISAKKSKVSLVRSLLVPQTSLVA